MAIPNTAMRLQAALKLLNQGHSKLEDAVDAAEDEGFRTLSDDFIGYLIELEELLEELESMLPAVEGMRAQARGGSPEPPPGLPKRRGTTP